MTSSQVATLIAKLNRQSKEGELTWNIASARDPGSLSASERLMGAIYISKVLDKYIRLYKYQWKYYLEEDHFEWSESYRMEFIDIRGNALWAFPADKGIEDLYSTIQYKTSGVEDFFEKYLDGENQGEVENNGPLDFF